MPRKLETVRYKILFDNKKNLDPKVIEKTFERILNKKDVDYEITETKSFLKCKQKSRSRKASKSNPKVCKTMISMIVAFQILPCEEDKLNEFMKYDVYEKLYRALSSTSSYSTERKKGQKERRNTRNTRRRHYSQKRKSTSRAVDRLACTDGWNLDALHY